MDNQKEKNDINSSCEDEPDDNTENNNKINNIIFIESLKRMGEIILNQYHDDDQ